MTDTAREATARPEMGDYLLAMSRELRAPINAVIGTTGLLLDDELTERQRQQVRSLHAAGESLSSIVNDLLDLARLGAGRLAIEPIPFDLRSMVEETASALTPRAAERGLALRVDWRPELPRHVIGDPGRTRQILANLVGHSVHGTGAGEVVIRVTPDGERPTGIGIRFVVEDTGTGMAPERVATLFDEYVPVDASPYRSFGITGLGLRLSAELVRLMDGALGVESDGRGNRYWFSLPVAVVAAEKMDRPELPETGRGGRVLLVEAEPASRTRFTEQVQAAGWEADFVDDEQRLVERLRDGAARGEPYRVCVLAGYAVRPLHLELATRLKADPGLASVALVMVTAVGSPGDGKRLWHAGFAAYLRKPVPREEILETLQALEGVGREGRSSSLITRHSLAEARNAQSFEVEGIDAMLASLTAPGDDRPAEPAAAAPDAGSAGEPTSALMESPPAPAVVQAELPVASAPVEPAAVDEPPAAVEPESRLFAWTEPERPVAEAPTPVSSLEPTAAEPAMVEPPADPADRLLAWREPEPVAPEPEPGIEPPPEPIIDAAPERVVAAEPEPTELLAELPLIEAEPTELLAELPLIEPEPSEASASSEPEAPEPVASHLAAEPEPLELDPTPEPTVLSVAPPPEPPAAPAPKPAAVTEIDTGPIEGLTSIEWQRQDPVPPVDGLVLEDEYDQGESAIVEAIDVAGPGDDIGVTALPRSERDETESRDDDALDTLEPEITFEAPAEEPDPADADLVPDLEPALATSFAAVAPPAAPAAPPPPLDLSSLDVAGPAILDQLAHGATFFTQYLVTAFLREAPARISALATAATRGDAAQAIAAAEGLGRASHWVGAARLAEVAARCRSEADAGRLDAAAGLLGTLEQAFHEARQALEIAAPRGLPAEMPPVGAGFLEQIAPSTQGPARLLAAKLVDSFTIESPARVADLRAAVARGDAELTQRLAQTLKGMCGLIGAEPFAKLCALVEADARLKRVALADRYLDHLDAELARVTGALATARG